MFSYHAPPLTIRNKHDALYNDVLSWLSPWSSASESEIDERVAALFELEEPSLVYDLRDHFSGRILYHAKKSKAKN